MGPERYGVRADYLAVLLEEIQRAQVALGRGQAKDFAAYQATVAQIDAFRRAAALFEQVLARYVEADEIDELR